MLKDSNQKIEELQILEAQIQNVLMQKQSLEMEVNEIKNAKEEIEKSDDEVYKITSGVMLKADKKNLVKELEERERVAKITIEELDTQQKILEKNSIELRKNVSKLLTEK